MEGLFFSIIRLIIVVVVVTVSAIVVPAIVVVSSFVVSAVVGILLLSAFALSVAVDVAEPAVPVKSIRHSASTITLGSTSESSAALIVTLVGVECIVVSVRVRVLAVVASFVSAYFFVDKACDDMLVVSKFIHLLDSYDIHTILFGNPAS